MLNTNFSIIDYIVFALLLLSSTFIGVFFWWKSRLNANNSEFLTGNRQLGLFPVTLSLVASFMSTNTVLGLPAEIYQMGTQFTMQIISITLGVVLAAEVFLPIYYRLGLVSVHEYLSKRFNSNSVRLAGSIGFLLASTPYMAVTLYGPSLALSSVTPISIPISILLVGSICTFYTSMGGIKAVIWTDVLQCILMFLGVLIVIVQGLIKAGGFGEMWRINDRGGRLKFFNMKFDAYNNDNFWNVVTGTSIFWCATFCSMQTQVQRYCSLGSSQNARRALYFNLPGILLLCLMAIMCGMVIYARYYNCDPITLGNIGRHDQLMLYFVMDTLSEYPGLPGIFVACVFSAALSTLSSGFNALAAVTWEDILKDRIKVKNDKRVLTITKLLAIGYGILAIVMSFGVGNIGTVLQACMAIVGSMVGPLFALFCLGVLFPHANAQGSLVGFICGILTSLTLSIGSFMIARPKLSLPTSIDHCPVDVLKEVYLKYNGFPNSTFIPSYDNPQGMGKIFHISYLLMSSFGFLLTLIIGIILSLFIGKNNIPVDPRLISPIPKNIFNWIKSIKLYYKKLTNVSNNKGQYKPNSINGIIENINKSNKTHSNIIVDHNYI